ncbi:MAG TPA: hypothetical protein ENK23_05265 [Sorangium sp.]|nr:hypothetical protein [Sorangium sp.]
MLFVQLAKALGCEAALADTQLRRLTVAELRAALAHDPSLFPALAPHLSIDNDGTIACLVEFFPISGTTLSAGESTQRLQQLAAGGDAVPAAEKRLVDAWVCLQALDYIAGHGTRRRWFVDRRSGRITGVDNMSVFRAYVDAVVLESLRKRLAATRHFPVPLRQALQKNSVHTLISQLTMDSFFEQPLGPRQRADIADRILTLKSLVHARPAHLQ